MPHRSDSNYRLEIEKREAPILVNTRSGQVYVIHLPVDPMIGSDLKLETFRTKFESVFQRLAEDSIIIFLSETRTALQLIAQLNTVLHYRLWIAIERSQPLNRNGLLPDNHAAITIFSKHNQSFKHCKIQTQYTLCPACHKTTKDYGGKKHLYSPYGTLMSDVWRDIKINMNEFPENVLERLADLFAIEPYEKLEYYDFRSEKDLCKSMATKQSSPNNCYSNSLQSRLIQGDCLEILKTLPEASIDFVFADPPYNIKKKYDRWDDSQQIEDYFHWCDAWIQELYRILKPGKVFCILNIPLWIVRHYLYAKDFFEFVDYIVWEALGLPVRNIMPSHYGILCLTKGNYNSIANYDNQLNIDTILNSSQSLKEWYCLRQSCVKKRNKLGFVDREPLTNLWWDIHRLKHNSKRVDHPCQLPPALMRRLIYTFTHAEDIVLDPFNGAGTTTLVAAMMNRNYIGIELSEKYHKIAEERHLEIVNGLDPFRKNGSVPKAKNSRVPRLSKQGYEVSKKGLQLEVKRIAQIIGKKPTKEDVKKHSQYPFEYFEQYFIDWGEVCAAVGDKGMTENPNDGDDSTWQQLTLLEKRGFYSVKKEH